MRRTIIKLARIYSATCGALVAALLIWAFFGRMFLINEIVDQQTRDFEGRIGRYLLEEGTAKRAGRFERVLQSLAEHAKYHKVDFATAMAILGEPTERRDYVPGSASLMYRYKKVPGILSVADITFEQNAVTTIGYNTLRQ